jgi:hypothetical protein
MVRMKTYVVFGKQVNIHKIPDVPQGINDIPSGVS